MLLDIITMNPNDSMGNQSDGNYSVSKGLVYFGFPKNNFGYAVKSVCCILHGAMLAVAELKQGGMLYRCEVCNNGAILTKNKEREDNV